jgi:hypothetical protein
MDRVREHRERFRLLTLRKIRSSKGVAEDVSALPQVRYCALPDLNC